MLPAIPSLSPVPLAEQLHREQELGQLLSQEEELRGNHFFTVTGLCISGIDRYHKNHFHMFDPWEVGSFYMPACFLIG